MSESTKRIDWIDTVKGLGIFLVILGHAGATPAMFSYIFNFHMALFFFVSGFLFIPSKHPNFFAFLKSRVMSILVPYVCFSIISMVFQILYVKLGMGAPHSVIDSVTHYIKDMVVSKRNSISYNIPLWFLTSLFTTEILYYLIRRYIPNRAAICVILITLGYFGVIKYQTLASAHTLPWSFDATMFYIVFFGIASLWREQNFVFTKWEKLISLGAFLVVNAYSFFKPSTFGLIINYASNITIPMIGILGYIFLAQMLNNKVLQYIGKNSLTIFSLHMLVVQVLIYLYGKYKIDITFDHGLRDWVSTGTTLLVLIPVVYIINRYFPFILGKFNLKTNSNIVIKSRKKAAV